MILALGPEPKTMVTVNGSFCVDFSGFGIKPKGIEKSASDYKIACFKQCRRRKGERITYIYSQQRNK